MPDRRLPGAVVSEAGFHFAITPLLYARHPGARTMNRREILQAGSAAVSAAALSPLAAFAQAKYPERPIKLLIPFSAGGVTDIVGRHWAERMKTLGTFYVENQGGGSGTIGASEVARSAPDGYTLMLGNSSVIVLNPMTSSHLSYNPAKDFTPISIICVASVALVVHESVPVKTLKEFVAYAKAHPGKLSYGSAGTGTMTQLAAEQFKQATGLGDLVHIPYKGAGPGLSDLVSGHIPVMTPNVTNQVLEFHKTGKVRILAVFAPERLKGAPDIPTAIEEGFPDQVGQLFVGIFAPAATPKPIVAQIADASRKVMQDPAFDKILVASGLEPVTDSSPDKARDYLASEVARWAPVVKAIGLKLD
jgi:tripartite-type tricarboxylate transporter receptor subunit TctC